MKEKMFRVTMTFKKKKLVTPGHDTTYIKAASATEAIAIAKKNHKKDFGGFVDGKARVVS